MFYDLLSFSQYGFTFLCDFKLNSSTLPIYEDERVTYILLQIITFPKHNSITKNEAANFFFLQWTLIQRGRNQPRAQEGKKNTRIDFVVDNILSLNAN